MAISSSAFVSQKQIAAELGLSTRRVRQLAKERVLPAPTTEGYDRATCVDRYDLYSVGNRGDWSQFHEGLLKQSREVERLIARALAGKPDEKAIGKASGAVQALLSDLHFSAAAESSSAGERDFLRIVFDQMERDTMAPLIWRTCELMAERAGITPEEVAKKIDAEARRAA